MIVALFLVIVVESKIILVFRISAMSFYRNASFCIIPFTLNFWDIFFW